MKTYLYRRGNGNEGNFIRALVMLKPTDCPYTALRALVVNDYIPGSATRRHIIRNIQIDGEAEYGIAATVHEAKNGSDEFGAAWLTAELEPLSDSDVAHYEGQRMKAESLRDLLDRSALRLYRTHAKE